MVVYVGHVGHVGHVGPPCQSSDKQNMHNRVFFKEWTGRDFATEHVYEELMVDSTSDIETEMADVSTIIAPRLI